MKHSEIESIPDNIHKQMNFMSEIIVFKLNAVFHITRIKNNHMSISVSVRKCVTKHCQSYSNYSESGSKSEYLQFYKR